MRRVPSPTASVMSDAMDPPRRDYAQCARGDIGPGGGETAGSLHARPSQAGGKLACESAATGPALAHLAASLQHCVESHFHRRPGGLCGRPGQPKLFVKQFATPCEREAAPAAPSHRLGGARRRGVVSDPSASPSGRLRTYVVVVSLASRSRLQSSQSALVGLLSSLAIS